MKKWLITLGFTLLIILGAVFLQTPGLAPEGKAALFVFFWCIVLWIIRPIPEYLTSIVGAAILLLLKKSVPADILGGFADPTWWMIVFASFLGASILGTGLGRRLAYTILNKLGTSVLKVMYATTMTNNILAPFTPSNTARGAIVYGVTEGINDALGFKKGEKQGDHTISLANMYITATNSNMFLTALGGNAIFVSLIMKFTGHGVSWNQWFVAAFVPMLPAVLLLPYIIYKLFPPAINEVPMGKEFFAEKLASLGAMTRAEKSTLVIMLLTLLMWATEWLHHIPSTTTAFLMGIALLLPGIGAVNWKQIEKDIPWPTLLWLGFAMSLAGVVNKTKGFQWLVDQGLASAPWMKSIGFTGFMLVIIIVVIFAHILFSGMNAMGMIVIPVVMSLAKARGFDPYVAGLAAALAVGTGGFFLPFNSAPNLLFYSSGRYEISDHLKGALPLAILLVLCLMLGLFVWWPLIGLI
jgi:divalent anion:Na+ symporter, DASS family